MDVADAFGILHITEQWAEKLPEQSTEVDAHVEDGEGRIELALLLLGIEAAHHAGDVGA